MPDPAVPVADGLDVSGAKEQPALGDVAMQAHPTPGRRSRNPAPVTVTDHNHRSVPDFSTGSIRGELDSPAPLGGPQRTRNGLVKRIPRGTAGGRPREEQRTNDEPVVDRSPEDVRTMLSAFRSAHLRGEEAKSTNGVKHR